MTQVSTAPYSEDRHRRTQLTRCKCTARHSPLAPSRWKNLRLPGVRSAGDDEYMEPKMNRPATMLAMPATLALLVDEGPSTEIEVEFRYDCSDPYAVQLVFVGLEKPTTWIFARALLAGGAIEPTGDGDIHIWPGATEQGESLVLIELATDEEEAILAALSTDIAAFLAKTDERVAPGTESDHYDIDAVIADMLAGTVEGISDE